jgi:hypothetical protein
MIIVYTDYDADGITAEPSFGIATSFLVSKPFLTPHRQHEGYGFSLKGIDFLKKEYNPALIISVDHEFSPLKKITLLMNWNPSNCHRPPLEAGENSDAAEAIFHILFLSDQRRLFFCQRNF